MSSDPTANQRTELTAGEQQHIRAFMSAMTLHGQVTAEAAGLHPTDLYVLNLLDLTGEATASELAKRTALTTGAITKLIDRLAHAGLVERRADPTDRRRVVLRLVPSTTTEALGGIDAPLFTPIATRMNELIGSFPAEQRLALLEFFRLAADELREATDEVQQTARTRKASRPTSKNSDVRLTARRQVNAPPKRSSGPP